jgi:hypothetical protein
MDVAIYLLCKLTIVAKGITPVKLLQLSRCLPPFHYNGEKALEFGLYLDKVKEMFNIFHDCGKPQPEAAKLLFIFDTIESPGLTHTISLIRAQLGQDPTAWTFVTAAKHLASQIKPTARPGRQLLSVASNGSPRSKDGSPVDLYPSNKVWITISTAEKKKIFTAHQLASNGCLVSTSSYSTTLAVCVMFPCIPLNMRA